MVVPAGELGCLLMFERYPTSWLPPAHLAQSLDVCFPHWPAAVTSSHTILVRSWRSLGSVCGERMAVAWELSARVRSGEFMLQGHGVLKLEVQMECAQ